MSVFPWTYKPEIQYKQDADVDKALERAGFHIERVGGGRTNRRRAVASVRSKSEQERLWKKTERELKKLPSKSKQDHTPKYGGFERSISEGDLDPHCRNSMKVLWKKGYGTNYSCQGHTDSEMFEKQHGISKKDYLKKNENLLGVAM